jgi:chaperonin GroEL (HSP60 family)
LQKQLTARLGDGTTSSVVLAGALLEKAESLIDDEIHSVIIADGYKKASRKAVELLNDIAITVDPKDREILEKNCIYFHADKAGVT